jgi:anti-sigma-K factor RskA
MTLPVGPDHERWQDSSGAYLLGALPLEEAAEYEAHLEACAACRAEVEHLHPAAAALPASALPVRVPDAVGERVMAEVRREAELLGGAGRTPAPRTRGRRAWWRWPAPALAAAALLVGLAVGLGAAGVIGPSEKIYELTATGAARGAHVRLMIKGDRAELVADDLRAPSGGRVYQVWLKPRGGEPEPTQSLFVPRADGHATVSVPSDAGHMEAVLVTAEPGGGSPAPTSAPVLSADMS